MPFKLIVIICAICIKLIQPILEGFRIIRQSAAAPAVSLSAPVSQPPTSSAAAVAPGGKAGARGDFRRSRYLLFYSFITFRSLIGLVTYHQHWLLFVIPRCLLTNSNNMCHLHKTNSTNFRRIQDLSTIRRCSRSIPFCPSLATPHFFRCCSCTRR